MVKKSQTVLVLLASAAVLGGGGYTAYTLNQPGNPAQTKKHSKVTAVKPTKAKQQQHQHQTKEKTSQQKVDQKVADALAEVAPAESPSKPELVPFDTKAVDKQLSSPDSKKLLALADQTISEQSAKDKKPEDKQVDDAALIPTVLVPDSEDKGPDHKEPDHKEPDHHVPVITVASNLYFHEGDTAYNALAGVNATDEKDGDLTAVIRVTGYVNTKKVGIYYLAYHVTNSAGDTTTVYRCVVISNDSPELISAASNIVEVGQPFDPLKGVTASDYQDGDLTVSVHVTGTVDTSKPGSYPVTYTATDKFGQTASATVTVNVAAEKPTLDVTQVVKALKVGETFNPGAGVKATSPYGAVKLTVTGTVDTSKPGTYLLTYSITDCFGQTVSTTVTINVQPK